MWTGDGLPFQTVDTNFFYAPNAMTFTDHLKIFDVGQKTGTVIGVCLVLATMWFVGEILFITKKARDAVNAKEEKEQIAVENTETERNYEQDPPQGLLMATRPASDYPSEWSITVAKWRARLKKNEEVSAASGYVRGILMYCMYFLVGNGVVALFLVI